MLKSVYNIADVEDDQTPLSSRLLSFQRAEDEYHTLPLKSSQGVDQKRYFAGLAIKLTFSR